ncbi:MAG: hypothetical protein JO089_06470 [Alphaproteobacteria bacterium]|nr:hypothetical protein [Alphaproteobacteria bacterium]
MKEAIAAAERRTAAELALVVTPASDAYQSGVLLYGITAGTVLSLGLWVSGALTDFPLLLLVQLGAAVIISLIPWLRHACIRLLPRRMRQHRAARRAFEEYLHASRHFPATAAVVLIYISLAERYAHVLASHAVREHIPDETWSGTIDVFTQSVRGEGLKNACVRGIQHAADILAPYFPKGKNDPA